MAVTLSSLAGAAAQFFDNNGVPLAGGLIYTYTAGTTTPAATYTSSTGLTAHANPIVLDAAGRIPTGEIWLTTGVDYKFLVKTSANVQLGSYDNIPSINDFTVINAEFAELANTSNVALGDAMVGFRQSNSTGNLPGAIGRTVHQKFQETISVKDFGAIGDGTTNNTTAIQAAIDSCVLSGASLYFPAGEYLVNAALNITGPITLFGDGYFSKIKLNSITSDLFYVTGTGVNIQMLSMGSYAAVLKTNGSFVNLNGASLVTIENFWMEEIFIGIKITGAASQAIKISNGWIKNFYATPAGGAGILMDGTAARVDVRVTDVLIAGDSGQFIDSGVKITNIGDAVIQGLSTLYCTIGLSVQPDVSQNIQALFVNNSYFDQSGSSGIAIIGGNAGGTMKLVKLTDCWSCSNGQYGIQIFSSGTPIQEVDILNCIVSNNTQSGVAVLSSLCTGVRVIGGSFSANGGWGLIADTDVTKFYVTNATVGPSAEFQTGNISGGIALVGNNNFILLQGNDVSGNVGTPILTSTLGSSCVIENNIGYNPVGASAIIVGASPFTYTAGATSESLFIKGGTVTDISVSGLPVLASTGVSIFLGANQSIVITYSSIPSMYKRIN